MVEAVPYISVPDASARRQPLIVMALSVAIAALLVAAGLSVAVLSGGGSSTPEDAVRGLLTAAGNGDIVGVLDHLDPAERDALAGSINGIAGELKRLGVISNSADLNHVSGVAASFTGLTLSTESLRDGLTDVRITGGQVHTNVDPATLPVGPFLKSVLGDSLSNAKPSSHDTALKLTVPVATVRRDGSWYVSIGYTVAEAIRQHAHLGFPTSSVPAVGAASPTQAVADLLQAIGALDARRLVELTPPDEMAALHEYAPLFLDKAAAAASQPDAPKITISDLGLSSATHAGGELVHITHIAVHVVSGGTTFDYSTATHCLKVTGPSVPPIPTCAGSSAPSDPTAANPFASLHGLNLHPDLGIVVVQNGGKWYVSPLRTVLDDVLAVLHALPTDVLDKIRQAFSNGLGGLLVGGLAGLGVARSSTSFSRVGTSLGGTSASGASGPSPIGSMIQGVGVPSLGPCRSGVRTVTFPPSGTNTSPTMTIPCGQP
jgi:hypothetical protein